MNAGAVGECRRACRPVRRQSSRTLQRRAVLVNMLVHILMLEAAVDLQVALVVEVTSTRTAATSDPTDPTGRTLSAPRRRVSRMLLCALLLLSSACPLSSTLLMQTEHAEYMYLCYPS